VDAGAPSSAPFTTSRRSLLRGAAAVVATASFAPAAFAQARPLSVLTTTAMLGDAARAVGGARVAVTTLLGEGVDPHVYKPTRADTARMLSADVIIANGLHLEAQFKDAFEQIGRTKPVVLAGEALPRDRLLSDEDYKDRFDPHIWMDPDLWKDVVLVIRDTLKARDPAGARAYDDAGAAYAAEVAGVADYARTVLGSVPKERRVLVTAHDAFAYFARAFSFEVVGIQGVSTESEAGLRRIEEVVDLVVKRAIPAVFVEASVSDRNVLAVVEGAARRGHTLAVGPQLFSDSMGAPGTYEGTYLGMVDHNVTAIAVALGGTAPAKGRAGRLSLQG
jgi:manganese/zinc/iron transport system substrate-binding protein